MTSNETITETSNRPCIYCHEPVTAEYEPEGRYFYVPDHHWSCWQTNPAGRYAVRTVQAAVTPARINEDRYTTKLRAIHAADELRRWNLRKWRCGEFLAIAVIDRYTGNVLHESE